MLNFQKYQGLGNDFIVINDLSLSITIGSKAIAALCDRHFGIGADGLIFVRPSSIADFEMAYYNADGGRVEMCGNGIRCLAKYIADNGLKKKDELKIETGAGIKNIKNIYENGEVSRIQVDMGIPEFDPKKIPLVADKQEFMRESLEVEDRQLEISCVSMGNPHCVIFVDSLDAIAVDKIGPYIEHLELFPKLVNVEFAHVLSKNEAEVRVWERGVGETLACGTGACAVVAIGSKLDMLERETTIHLRGGDLNINWLEQGSVLMTGPARFVFEGNLDLKVFMSEGV